MTNLYIGAPITYASERAVLERILESLARERRPAVILGNVSVGSRQIDCIVGLNELAIVIEAKGCSRPIRGGANGTWQVQVASGDWKNYQSPRNPYVQARNAALCVKDAMRSVASTDVPYLAAAVVFVPRIPHRSDVYAGDFKVSVTGLDGVDELLRVRQKDALSLDCWKAFAERLHLTPVSTVANACDPVLFEAEDLLRQYTPAFCRAYTQPEPMVPFTCRSADSVISSADVAHLIAEGEADILIRGPSGCGKTLLAMEAGLSLAESGGIVVVVPAKNYSGSLKAVLDREVGLLIDSTETKVLGAARRLNRPLLFVVDGYNECVELERLSLTRSIAALARKYEGGVLVTSQTPLERGELLTLRTVDVPPATMETKISVALNVTGSDALPKGWEHLLGAVTSGLEARLIGEVGQQLARYSSRHTLFDLFVRNRLGDSAGEGIRLLSQLAGLLSDRVAFSLSLRDFDRLLDKEDIPHELATLLQTAGLLGSRGDRVSFAHEMFLNAFAAEDVIRSAADQSRPVLGALASPKHADRKAFIIGAIDDDLLRDQVLEGLTDAESIAACVAGACGRAAREWAEARCEALWKGLRAEALGVSFHISDHGWENVAFEETTLTAWTPLERAFLAAMAQRIVEGCYLDEVLDTIGVLDQRIVDEAARLRDDARERKVALQRALFANSYVYRSSTAPGITQICAQLHGSWFHTTCDAVAGTIRQSVGGNNLSPGQVYLLLMLSRGADTPAPFVVKAIESHWAGAPYHLKLYLIDAACICHLSDDGDRAALVATIEALPQSRNIFISTTIVEALQRLGALEDSEREHIAVVSQEIKECLSDPEDADHHSMAYGLYAAQFDHPYSGAYCEAIAELPEDDRKSLLRMAASGVTDSAFFLVALLVDLLSFGDPGLGDSISRWTAMPPKDSFMPQDSIAALVIAHIALARLGRPLPHGRDVADGHSAEALAACGKILYWCNRSDLDQTARRHACDAPLQVLLRHERGAALDVIRECEDALDRDMSKLIGPTPVERSIMNTFPIEATEICRHALAGSIRQIGYFRHYSEYDRQQNLTFAINVLAQRGSSTDLRLLREYAEDPAFGTSAIAAVRTIEDRLGTA